MIIKEHPELLESCTSENSHIIEKETVEELMSTIIEQSEILLDEASGKITSDPPSRVFDTICHQQKAHNNFFERFLRLKDHIPISVLYTLFSTRTQAKTA